jgi:methylglyoxal synthase
MTEQSAGQGGAGQLRVGLVAHDAKKDAIVAWVGRWHHALKGHALVATGTTGRVIAKAHPDLAIRRLKSGPLGGDQQMGALVAEGELDALIFFMDPMTPMPHDVDVKALIRLAAVYDVPVACNPATADCVAARLATVPRRARP